MASAQTPQEVISAAGYSRFYSAEELENIDLGKAQQDVDWFQGGWADELAEWFSEELDPNGSLDQVEDASTVWKDELSWPQRRWAREVALGERADADESTVSENDDLDDITVAEFAAVIALWGMADMVRHADTQEVIDELIETVNAGIDYTDAEGQDADAEAVPDSSDDASEQASDEDWNTDTDGPDMIIVDGNNSDGVAPQLQAIGIATLVLSAVTAAGVLAYALHRGLKKARKSKK